MKRILLALLILLLPATAFADFPARVVGISDGDTLTVLRDGRTQVKIRLWGVDAPETGQDFGSRAKQAASELAFGKTVTIRERDKDRYGRSVAEVILPDGKNLGQEIVGQGYAWWYRAYAPKDRELAQAEATARAERRGLWAGSKPIPPWSWRKGEGVPVTAGVIGNRSSRVYHRPSCRGVAVLKESNRVEFATAAEAEEAGYRRAGDCREGSHDQLGHRAPR